MPRLRRRLPFLSFNQKTFVSSSALTATITTKSHSQIAQQQQGQQLLSLLQKHQPRIEAVQQIHSHMITTGIALRTDMLFWNTLLRRYSLGTFPEEALILYKYLQRLSFSSHFFFDSFTYSFLLKACANLDFAIGGFQLHALTVKLGFEYHVYVQTALVNMYGVCGFLDEAEKVFDGMPERNSVTWNAMVTGFCKWGELSLARSLFDKIPNRTVVSWTVIIDGYTRMNQPFKAIALFRRMVVQEGIKPNEITVLAILPAISNLGALEHCQCIHTYGEKSGFNAYDIRVTNSLVDAYAKCGCIKSASRVFNEISAGRRNLVSWTSIISGFAMHGMAREAVENFERMERECLKPNRVTFLSVLNACSHGGLVEEGLMFFKKMVNDCRVLLDFKHYGCLLDMLGRAGRLEEAEKMANEVPLEIGNVVIWRTLLGACNHHGDVEMGERVTRKIMEMEKGYGGDYVLLSNIFAGVGRYSDAETVRRLMDERNASKVAGISLV